MRNMGKKAPAFRSSILDFGKLFAVSHETCRCKLSWGLSLYTFLCSHWGLSLLVPLLRAPNSSALCSHWNYPSWGRRLVLSCLAGAWLHCEPPGLRRAERHCAPVPARAAPCDVPVDVQRACLTIALLQGPSGMVGFSALPRSLRAFHSACSQPLSWEVRPQSDRFTACIIGIPWLCKQASSVNYCVLLHAVVLE